MFMDRKELKNALTLLKIRKKEMKVSLFFSFYVIFLLLVNSFAVCTIIFNNNSNILTYKLTTYTQDIFFFSLILLTILAFYYKTFNREHEVFPQTNKSRFLSYALFNYEFFLVMSVVALIAYLLQYGILSVIAGFNPNVHLAYDFSLSFVVWGFIVNVLYGCLAISILLFIGTLNRKYPIVFKVATIVVLSLILITNQFLGEYFLSIIGFLTKESSLIVFTLKAIGLWILISSGSWFINRNTVYFEIQSSKQSKKLVAGVGFALVFVIVVIILSANVFSLQTTTTKETSVSATENFQSLNNYTNIPLDTSHLKEGDSIKIITNCNFEEEGLFISNINADDFGDDVAFYGFDGKVHGLQLSYSLPSRVYNKVNLTPYLNPKLTAELKGTTLYLSYEYSKNQKLFYLSPYIFMGQFHAFKDKNLFKDFIGTSGSNRGGEIYIFAENGINISMPVYTTIN